MNAVNFRAIAFSPQKSKSGTPIKPKRGRVLSFPFGVHRSSSVVKKEDEPQMYTMPTDQRSSLWLGVSPQGRRR
jgi:hypothetical protein